MKIATIAMMLSCMFCHADLVKDETSFTLTLYDALNKEADNLIFSPYSIFSCMSMSYLGAKEETLNQIKKGLHLSYSPSELIAPFASLQNSLKSPIFNIANAVWVDLGMELLPSYKEDVKKAFDVDVQLVDFELIEQTREKINTWTSDRTKGKITELLEKGDITKETLLVLTNALYFEGSWAFPFNAKATKKAPFFLDSNKQIETNMMGQVAYFPYFETEEVQLVTLPISREKSSNAQFACVIMLPSKSSTIEQLTKKITPDLFFEWISNSKRSYMDIKVPKFCLKKRFDLNDALKKTGIELPFRAQADFSGIDGKKDLFISKVVHEAYFCFDEKGVTAAAATATAMAGTSFPSDEVTFFTANRPFLFFLIELNTKTVLFMGKLQQPETSDT